LFCAFAGATMIHSSNPEIQNHSAVLTWLVFHMAGEDLPSLNPVVCVLEKLPGAPPNYVRIYEQRNETCLSAPEGVI